MKYFIHGEAGTRLRQMDVRIMVPTMKNLLRLLPLFALVAATSLPAQDAARARAIADQQDATERYNRLSAQMEDLLTANADLQRKLGAMENDLRKTRAELLAELSKVERKADDGNGRYVTQDQLKKLVDAVNDLDKKRVEDDKRIVEEMRKLVQKIAGASASLPSPTPSAPRPNVDKPTVDTTPSNVPTKGFEHTVQKGEYLGTIISAYNEALKEKGVTKKITQSMVEKANPGLNPNKMAIGSKIFIPDPSQE
jgi:Skp family chaperone for outer membrane proteins